MKKGLLAGAASLSIPAIAQAAVEETSAANKAKVQLKRNSVILFQGDSITDAKRKRESNTCNSLDQLGLGYTLFTATRLLEKHADKQLKIYNRGISGNKVFQLRDRWEMDALAFQPDVLSILIGVNDFWHTLSSGYKGTVETYNTDLRQLLTYTKEKCPKLQLVLGEPFAIKGGSAIDNDRWFPKFLDYQAAAKEIAQDFKAIYVPYQTAFDHAMELAPARYWSGDGVHPDLPGRQLMASTWMEATGLR